MTKWQPIETAPLGDLLLLYFPEFDNDGRNRDRLSEMWKVGRVSEFPHRPPSHFQPLVRPGGSDKQDKPARTRGTRLPADE